MSDKTNKGIAKSIFSGIGTFIGNTLSGITVSLGTVLVIVFLVYLFRDRIHDFLIPPNEVTQINYTIESELHDIGELVTQEYKYSGVTEESNTRTFPFWGAEIPFTTNIVTVNYSGVIKVGYKVEDISVTVVNHLKIIYISMPEPIIISHEIRVDGYNQENNLLNPITGDRVNNMLENVKVLELNKAIEEEKIYDNAEEHAEKVVKEKLEPFGYDVVFF